MKKYILILFSIMFAAGISGCGSRKKPADNIVENGIYRNTFFGMTMDVPEGLYVMDRAERDSVSAAMGSIAGESLKEEMMSAELLLFISRYPFNSDEEGNYNVTVTSELLPVSLGIDNNQQYMQMALRMLENSGMGEAAAVNKAELGGREFIKLTNQLPGGTSQDMYMRYHDGYALVIVGTYAGEGQHGEVDRIIRSVSFGE